PGRLDQFDTGSLVGIGFDAERVFFDVGCQPKSKKAITIKLECERERAFAQPRHVSCPLVLLCDRVPCEVARTRRLPFPGPPTPQSWHVPGSGGLALGSRFVSYHRAPWRR